MEDGTKQPGATADAPREAPDPITVIGDGWIGRAVAAAIGRAPVPRRGGDALALPPHPVIVASGRSRLDERDPAAIDAELAHLADVLRRAAEAGAPRVVVLGSSDVAGTAAVVRGTTPAAPLSAYAEAKARGEEECQRWRNRGLDVIVARLAPVHGPGKERTRTLVRLAALPLTPVPGGRRHSVGFVLLDDAVRALVHLAEHGGPPVVAVGAGPTPLGELLSELSAAQGRHLRALPLHAPASLLRRACATRRLPGVAWAARLALPRSVEPEVPTTITPLPAAAAQLVTAGRAA